MRNHAHVVEVLLAAGCNVNALSRVSRGVVGQTRSCWHSGSTQDIAPPSLTVLMAVLLQDNSNALHTSIVGHHHQHHPDVLDVIMRLVAAGIDVNQATNNGDSPLHLAAWYDEPELIRTLLSHGAVADIKKHVRGA